ncbi:hypothetical protein [Lederbergia lenta]|nr:hypothetical protein [Lederbergia lenta]MCM3109944.1 hypothetical protein [Lederbergia lenta]
MTNNRHYINTEHTAVLWNPLEWKIHKVNTITGEITFKKIEEKEELK